MNPTVLLYLAHNPTEHPNDLKRCPSRYAVRFFVLLIVGQLSDWLLRGGVTLSLLRKGMTSISLLVRVSLSRLSLFALLLILPSKVSCLHLNYAEKRMIGCLFPPKVPAAALLVMAVSEQPEVVAVSLLVVGVGVSGAANVGAIFSPIEMYPESAGGA